MKNKKALLILLCIVLLSGTAYLFWQYSFETFLSDAAGLPDPR